MTSHYGHQAYNSQTAQRLDDNYQRPDARMHWLAMGNAQQRIPFRLFSQYTPRHMRIYAKKDPRPDWLKNDRYGAMHERYIRPINFSKFGAILVQAMRAGKILSVFGCVIAIITILCMATVLPSLSKAIHSSLIIILIVFFSIILWVLSLLAYKILPVKHGRGSPWELNRQTGLVSQFTYNQRNPKTPPQTNSAPFVEMDAFILPLLGRFGYTYLFYLKHRYSELSIRVGDFIGPVTDMNRYEELWDFIQNYMDISQPLPDITLFEDFRSQDPVTAAHDQQTGRHPHYWLAMDDKEWNNQLSNNPLLKLTSRSD